MQNRLLVGAACASCTLVFTVSLWAQPATSAAQYANDPAAMIEAYRHVEVSSVSDAIEQLLHKRTYMSHRMQAISPGKFAGFAVTVRMSKEENNDPKSNTAMQTAIDTGGKESVYVMSIEDGEDIAGIGGLMGTAMNARLFAGAVIDGGVRDVSYLRKIGFPVYGTGVVPSTSVGHYRASSNVSIICDGVAISPGDIVVADGDGVVAIPRANAAEVLVKAQQLDYTEHSMYGTIEKLRSLQQAVAQFGRL